MVFGCITLDILARDAFVKTNRRTIAMMFDRLSVRLFVWDGRALWPYGAHVHLLSAVFFQFHLEDRSGMDVQTKHDISRTVKDRGYVTTEC